MAQQQRYDFFIVLDFEAQCERGKQMDPQEIIEFPAILVDGKRLEVLSEFHHYVMPTVHRRLTPYCTELTGVAQSQVDGKPELREVLSLFETWLHQHGVLGSGSPPSFTFVTCGNWDLKTCLPAQAASLGIKLPSYFRRVSFDLQRCAAGSTDPPALLLTPPRRRRPSRR
jgi:inhibitor of KinA sporulation pathway (predicted exonuclease)